MDSAELAAYAVAIFGTAWLDNASDRDLSRMTDETCKQLGIARDTRRVITCLKAIRAYRKRFDLP